MGVAAAQKGNFQLGKRIMDNKLYLLATPKSQATIVKRRQSTTDIGFFFFSFIIIKITLFLFLKIQITKRNNL